MAHSISISPTGEAEVFVAGKPAWHGLGANVPNAVKWADAYRLAGLNWAVEKRPLFTELGVDADGFAEYKQLPAWGIFRRDSGKFFGTAGEDYTPLQNDRAFAAVDAILAVDGGASYVSAGAIHGGESVWCLAQLPEEIRIAGTDDVTQTYLLFVNSHRPNRAAKAKLCTTRVVCANTLSLALREAGTVWAIHHTQGMDARINAARTALFGIREQIADTDEIFNVLASSQVTNKVQAEVLKSVYPNIAESAHAQNRARTILGLFEDNDADAFPAERGTAFAFLNAFTRYTDHFSTVKKGDGESEEVARKRGALLGAGEAFKFAALQAIVHALGKNSVASFPINSVTRLLKGA